MGYTIIALGVMLTVLGILLWRARIRQLRGAAPTADDVWSAGADPDPAQSRAKKTSAWLAIGSVGGCGGCGGCGCGG